VIPRETTLPLSHCIANDPQEEYFFPEGQWHLGGVDEKSAPSKIHSIARIIAQPKEES
jgi:hypothetical protein